MEKTSDKLGTEKIAGLLRKQSLPAAMGFLIMSLYQLVDTYFVSQYVGDLAIAAIPVAIPIIFLMSAFGMAIGIGGGAVVSQSLGAGQQEKANRTFGNQLFLYGIIYSVLMFLVSYYKVELLELNGANEQVLPLALEYFNIILIGIPFLAFAMLANNTIRAEGKPKVAMLTLVIPAVVNIILDPILIYYLDMGMAGAAWATTIGYMLSGVYTMLFFLLKKSELDFDVKNLVPDLSIIKEIGAVGYITLVRNGMVLIFSIVLLNQLDKWGLKEYAASMGEDGGSHAMAIYGLIRGFTLFVAFPVIGIMQGMMPIVSYNFGSKQFDRVKETVWLAVKWATICSVALFGIIFLSAEPLIKFFSSDIELLRDTPRVLRLIFISLPLMGIGFVAGAYFQAISKPTPALILTLARQGLLMIPLMYILPGMLGLDGVWMSMPIGEIIAGIAGAIWLSFSVKQLQKSAGAAS